MNYIENENFQGYDPYDAMNSPVLNSFAFDKKYLRIIWTQLLKRFPWNIRPILGIKKDYNPKGLGLFLWSYAKLYKKEKNQTYLEKIDVLLDVLDKLKSTGYSGNCWGYNFDWQSRVFFLQKFTPTVVNTSFIGHALIDTYEYTGEKRALQMAIPIKDFILYDLNRHEEDSAICFSYTPIDKTAIHNANLLAASLLIRLYKYTNQDVLKDSALAGLAYTMKYQRDDGAWYYAETDFQNWIDSFHTGFNLQSILYFIEEGYGNEYKAAFKKGVDFYKNNFFLNDGTPKFYHDKIYPVDVHSAAQAIVFFSRLKNDFKDMNNKIAGWMIKNLQDKRGYFYLHKKRFFTNKISYMRWSQAWAFHALTEFLLQGDKTC